MPSSDLLKSFMTLVIDAHFHCTGREQIADAMQTLDEAGIDIGVLLALSLPMSDGFARNDPDSLERAQATVPMPDSPLWDSIQTAVTRVSAQYVDRLHSHMPNARGLAGRVGPGDFEDSVARAGVLLPDTAVRQRLGQQLRGAHNGTTTSSTR